MTDLLNGVQEQLDMGMGLPEATRTPLINTEDKQTLQPDQENFYNVVCNAGTFIVRASDEVFIDLNLTEGLSQPMPRVSHSDQLKETQSMQAVLELDDIDYSTVTVEPIIGAFALHLSTIEAPLVTYMGA